MENLAYTVLGIDIGSVSIHLVVMDQDGHIFKKAAGMHHGNIKQSVARLFDDISPVRADYIAVTDATPSYVKRTRHYDDQVAMIQAANHFHSDFDALLHIGGEKFSLSRFDGQQNYTGASHIRPVRRVPAVFLDQQARRLNLSGGSGELSLKALQNKTARPDIATRCAVFAKTDLIHAQQEGFSIEQICDGLCYGLARNVANTVFKKKEGIKKVLFCGGVSRNTSVCRHLEEITQIRLMIDPLAEFLGAAGAALCLLGDLAGNSSFKQGHPVNEGPSIKADPVTSSDQLLCDSKADQILRYPALTLSCSTYPDFGRTSLSGFGDVEADIYVDVKNLGPIKGYLGLDVGSTSTKSILIDDSGSPVAGFYTKTASRPVEAVQKIFKACDRLVTENQLQLEILGCGTTGSGRRLSGGIIGADLEPDEITAHARAACWLEPKVDTIIEIGGQDAKFTLLKDGVVTASTMNTVCAAGTGSFIEEQALKLDCPLDEYARHAENVSAPMSSDRCTVFMERDISTII